ncbi:MAG TPA: hypothetical protein VMY42_16525, partial [Thermoguttaceae bacterium]|nr:hypothetical protein [Thermoguttaceae bacterium]
WQVFVDLDGNGQFDAGEPSAITDAAGDYSIGGVAVGTHMVLVERRTGWEPTPPDQATVTPGATVTGPTFAARALPGTIEGEVFFDRDGDGQRDGGEEGLVGWQVYIDENLNGLLDAGEPAAATDANGNYVLPQVRAGTHTVAEVLSPVWVPTSPAGGSRSVIVEAGQIVTGIDFGNWAHTLYWDGEGDGDWDDPARWVIADGTHVGMIPDEALDVVVRTNTVTILAGSSARELTLQSGAILIGAGGSLTIAEDVSMTSEATYICQVSGATNGTLEAGGIVQLGGTLEIQPVGVEGIVPEALITATIITSSGHVLGEFDTVPPVHGFRRGPEGHLGIGVFHRGTEYVGRLTPDGPASAVAVDLFVAETGDANGDGYVNGLDINIVLSNVSQPGEPADRSWVRGDMVDGPIGRGDGYVDQADLDALLAHFAPSAGNGESGAPTVTVTIDDEPAEMVDRHVFYNNSDYDLSDAAANPRDDDAIAAGKSALMPGEIASPGNYTSYHRGINGVMVDVANLPAGITPDADDFEFLIGNGEDLSAWQPAPPPGAVTLRRDAGTDGSDRITIIWDDYAITNQWLQVTVLGVNLALAEDDVFYFGNVVAETGNSPADARVTTADLLLVRNNPRSFLDPATIDSPYDFNRDRRVNATDVLLARQHQTGFLDALELIRAPQAAGVALPQSAAEFLEPAASQEAPADPWAWIDEIAQITTANRASQKPAASAAAVDELLATYW